MNFTGGPPGRKVDRIPLISCVKVAAPVFPTISLTVKRKMVPIGTAMTPYKPGMGAGMKAVVNVTSEERHPKAAIKTKSLDLNNLSPVSHRLFQVSSIDNPLPSKM